MSTTYARVALDVAALAVWNAENARPRCAYDLDPFAWSRKHEINQLRYDRQAKRLTAAEYAKRAAEVRAW